MQGKKEDYLKRISDKMKMQKEKRKKPLFYRNPFNLAAIPQVPKNSGVGQTRLYLKMSTGLSKSIISMYK